MARFVILRRFNCILEPNMRRQFCEYSYGYVLLKTISADIKPWRICSSKASNTSSQLPNVTAIKTDSHFQSSNVCESFAKEAARKPNCVKLEKVIALLKSRTARHKQRLAVLDGPELIKTVFNAGISIRNVYYTHEHFLNDLPVSILSAAGATFLKIQGDQVKQASLNGLTSVFGVCSIPDNKSQYTNLNSSSMDKRLPVTVVCDNIRDPGNMAVLITSAVATSCRQLLFTKGCVDVWDPKVLKSSCGAVFNINFTTDCELDDVESVFGREGDYDVVLADCSTVDSCQLTAAVCDYDSFSYGSCEHVVLVIGGETHGVSEAAHNLCAASRRGQRIRIPMLRGVDSLNSSMSASIILYEIYKQIMPDGS